MNSNAVSIAEDAGPSGAAGPGGDPTPDRLQAAHTILRRARRRDRVAGWVISLGGAAVILSVVAILAAIVGEAFPLFLPARCPEAARGPLPAGIDAGEVLAMGVTRGLDNSPDAVYALLAGGTAVWFDPATGTRLGQHPLAPGRSFRASGGRNQSPRIVRAEHNDAVGYSLVWSDGSVSLAQIEAGAEDRATPSSRGPAIGTMKLSAVLPAQRQPPARAVARRCEDDAITAARVRPDGRLEWVRQQTRENMLGEKETTAARAVLDTVGLGPIRVLAMDDSDGALYAGTQTGQLARWKFDKDGRVVAHEALTAFADRRTVTAMVLASGGDSLVVGDGAGEVSVWGLVRRDGKPRLTQRLMLARHGAPVVQLVALPRTRAIWSVDAQGAIRLDHITSRRNLAAMESDRRVWQLGISARGDAVVTLSDDGEVAVRRVDSPHPEVSPSALFGRVWYESYEGPDFVWQSTGGDQFEAKYSLVPLLSGTLKGTFYAMLLAGPLGLFGAIYVSHFTTPRLKRLIKPTIEVMAAVPSVVLGFLAALWLAPLMERGILVVFLALATIPAAWLAFLAVWQWVRRFETARRVENGYEFLLALPVIAAGVAAAWLAAPAVESLCFGGDFREWLYRSLDLRYDQRNCVVIAFALGFTVIPILLSLAEDALSGVPHALTASSMAMGASRWQTLWRVVLPSASPGIFAGLMIALGRAVGETMIVLMAAGNTPITSWSLFNGMRTLSANIAVEASEAPVGGTHYRVLFLCAVLLFLLTFTLNTAAEIVRQRLRRRYGRFA